MSTTTTEATIRSPLTLTTLLDLLKSANNSGSDVRLLFELNGPLCEKFLRNT